MAYLPEEIISHEIFSKLPPKSLVRFKCVSKSYNALISSPEFIKHHLRESRSSSDANHLLILVGKDRLNLYSINVDSPDDSVTTIPLPRILDESKPDNVSIVGSIDGLICLVLETSWIGNYSQSFKYILINPSTRIFRDIPYKHPLFPSFVYFPNNIRSSFGFGFDDVNHDYKLVRVTDVERFNVLFRKRVTYIREVIVYSLNQNTWKQVELVQHPGPKDSLMDTQNGVLIKNHLLHWVFSVSNRYRIGCFDTRSDKWVSDVPLMSFLEHNTDSKFRVRSLGVINGCLCLCTTNTSSGVLWMLKDYQAKESWVKLFHITDQFLTSRLSQFTQPFFCFRRESKYEVLVANLNRDYVFWYDDIGPITYGRIKQVESIPAFVGGCLCTESLVQIPGGSRIIHNKLNDLFSMLMLI